MALLALAAPLSPLASGEVTQKGNVRVSVQGKLTPQSLPRDGVAPISVSVSGRIGATGSAGPPQLRKIAIAINRHGRLSSRGLPLCRIGHIDPSTTSEALSSCGSSLIGAGSFSANVKLPEQSPFPSHGRVVAFNGRLRGRPAILAHIYGTKPVPTSYVLPFLVRSSRGTFGTVLEASLPKITGDWGYVTGIAMTLERRFSFRGKQRSFLNAGCPAPAGFKSVIFPLLRTSFGFDGGLNLTDTLTRSCRVEG